MPMLDNLDRFFSGEFANEFVSVLHNSFQNLGLFPNKQEDGSLQYSIDVPGVKEEDLKVEVVGCEINVSGERKNQNSNYSINKLFIVPDGFDIESRTFKWCSDAKYRTYNGAYATRAT